MKIYESNIVGLWRTDNDKTDNFEYGKKIYNTTDIYR